MMPTKIIWGGKRLGGDGGEVEKRGDGFFVYSRSLVLYSARDVWKCFL
jgi:hypothetical protein